MTEGFTGAEIEQVVISACFDAFDGRQALQPADLEREIGNTVPLAVTQAEQIAALRAWADVRAVVGLGAGGPRRATPPSGAGDRGAGRIPERRCPRRAVGRRLNRCPAAVFLGRVEVTPASGRTSEPIPHGPREPGRVTVVVRAAIPALEQNGSR